VSVKTGVMTIPNSNFSRYKYLEFDLFNMFEASVHILDAVDKTSNLNL